MTKNIAKDSIELEPMEELDLKNELSQDSEPLSKDSVVDDLVPKNKKDSKDAKEYILLSDILPNPLNVKEVELTEQMINSFMTRGIIEPITVRKRYPWEEFPEGYVVVDGDHRTKFLKEKMPKDHKLIIGPHVIIKTYKDILSAFTDSCHVNEVAKRWGAKEWFKFFDIMADLNRSATQRELAEIAGASKSTVADYQKAWKESTAIEKEQMKTGKLSVIAWIRNERLPDVGQDEISAGGNSSELEQDEDLSTSGQETPAEEFSTIVSDELFTEYYHEFEDDDVKDYENISEVLVKAIFTSAEGLERFLNWITEKAALQAKNVQQQVTEQLEEKVQARVAELQAKEQFTTKDIDLKTFNKVRVDKTEFKLMQKLYKHSDFRYNELENNEYEITFINLEQMEHWLAHEKDREEGVLFHLKGDLTVTMSLLVYADYFDNKHIQKIFENLTLTAEGEANHTWTVCFKKYEYLDEFIDYLKTAIEDDLTKNTLYLALASVSSWENEYKVLKELNAAIIEISWGKQLLQFFTEEDYLIYLKSKQNENHYKHELKVTKTELTAVERHHPDRFKRALVDDSQKGKLYIRFNSTKDFQKIIEFLQPARDFKYKPIGIPFENLQEKDTEKIRIPLEAHKQFWNKDWMEIEKIKTLLLKIEEANEMTTAEIIELKDACSSFGYGSRYQFLNPVEEEKANRKLINKVEHIQQVCSDCRQLYWKLVSEESKVCTKCLTNNKHTSISTEVLDELEATK